MAGTYTIGEKKIRPGTYFRTLKKGNNSVVGATNGICAVVFRADFGPLGKAEILTPDDDYTKLYGDGGTTDTIREVLLAGVYRAICVRVGNADAEGVTYSTITLKSGETDAVKLTAKYPGSKPFSITIRDKVTDSTLRQAVIYTGTTVFETVEFAKGDDEVAALIAAMKKDKYFVSANASDTAVTGTLADVTVKAFTAGTDPSITTTDYTSALSVIEKYKINSLCVDTEDTAVHALCKAYLDRIYNHGQFGVFVAAENPDEVDLETRQKHAANFNSEKDIYVLNAAATKTDGTAVRGYQVAARIAGLEAIKPCNQSMTHDVISDYATLDEILTPTQMEDAEAKGCFVLSLNTEDQVWVDNAINTLITLSQDQDEGWKKIRRVKTRQELMDRANTTGDAYNGKVDNDDNGRLTVKSALQDVIDAMIGESKLVAGTVDLDTKRVSDGDYAYYVFDIIDKDSIEHLYLDYVFQFSTNVES